MKDFYKVTSDHFDEQQYEQTDFGRIYYATPKERKEPASIEELAETLKGYNKNNEPVTIRNTGHSLNGQTLTRGVQVYLGGLKWVNFDHESNVVAVGAGTSWDQMLQEIDFPNISPTVFTNNPRQEIHVGGTAAVGGIGLFSLKYGGFWNTVTEITLVTMEGKIITCSRDENPEYFQYSLGGFGRIGVIAEIKIQLQPAKPNIMITGIFFTGHKNFIEAAKRAITDPRIDSVSLLQAQAPIPFPFMQNRFMAPHVLTFLCEVGDNSEIQKMGEYIKDEYGHGPILFVGYDKEQGTIGGFSTKPQAVPRSSVVYWYPEDACETRMDLVQVWGDYIIPQSQALSFAKQSEEILARYNFADALVKIPIGLEFTKAGIGFYGAYSMRRVSDDFAFPLVPDLTTEKESMAFGSFLSVSREESAAAIQLTNELTDLAFRLGGKRYLYSYHDLNKDQIEKQYNKDTLQRWQEIKETLDPKGLLNRGVIEHLDDF